MTTLSKLIIVTIMGLLMLSCNMDFNISGVKGNGNVISKERTVNGDFNAIKVSRGLDVYITQGNNTKVTVEADENLHDIIITEVQGNTMVITADKNIGTAKSRKVHLTFVNVDHIKSSSGSDVISTNTITATELQLESSSGSDLEVEVDVESLDCSSSSGSDMKISGTTDKLYVEASSGSDIKAQDLKAVSTQAKASSGADITVNTSEELMARVSSGADIKYHGNPKVVQTNDSPSGSIKQY